MPYNLIIPSISLNFNAFSLSILPFFGFDLVSHFFFWVELCGVALERIKIQEKKNNSDENHPFNGMRWIEPFNGLIYSKKNDQNR